MSGTKAIRRIDEWAWLEKDIGVSHIIMLDPEYGEVLVNVKQVLSRQIYVNFTKKKCEG